MIEEVLAEPRSTRIRSPPARMLAWSSEAPDVPQNMCHPTLPSIEGTSCLTTRGEKPLNP